MTARWNRRTLVTMGAAAGVANLLPRPVGARAERLTAAILPRVWPEAHSTVVGPTFAKLHQASVEALVMSGAEQIARLTADRGRRPSFDVAMLGPLQLANAVQQQLVAEYPTAQSTFSKQLPPAFQDKWGPTVAVDIVGIGYNPKTVPTPPSAWEELSDFRRKGRRIGLISPETLLGLTFLAELNRSSGGTDDDFGPAFEALKRVLPLVGGVVGDYAAFDLLWQREQIDIGPHTFTLVQAQRAANTPIDIAFPRSGGIRSVTSLHVVANASEPELAAKYIDAYLHPDVQGKLSQPPFHLIPVNPEAKLERVGGNVLETLGNLRTLDWPKLALQRQGLIERFNREFRA